jgi:DNA modification methylase
MISLLKGDCLKVMDNLLQENLLIDLAITSPPYDNMRKYDGLLQWNEKIWKAVIIRLFHLTKEGGVVVWVVGDSVISGSESCTSFEQALYFKDCGFSLHDTMIWDKGTPSFPSNKRYGQSFDYMFVFTKGKIKTANLIHDRINKCSGRSRPDRKATKEMGARMNIWTIISEKGRVRENHPAIFPEQLAKDHITTWSNKGDLVFDPFMGSGTTGKMAVLLNRDFIGIEKVSKYFKFAEERISKAKTFSLDRKI